MTDNSVQHVTVGAPQVGVVVQAERYGVPVRKLDPAGNSLDGQAFLLFLAWWGLGRPEGDFWAWAAGVATIEPDPEDQATAPADPTPAPSET